MRVTLSEKNTLLDSLGLDTLHVRECDFAEFNFSFNFHLMTAWLRASSREDYLSFTVHTTPSTCCSGCITLPAPAPLIPTALPETEMGML